MVYSRWGWVPPAIPGAKPRNPYLTNIRNTDSRFWLPALKKTSQRCLVPVTSFAEPSYNNGPKAEWTWFAQDGSRPLMFFAGVFKTHEGDRGTKSNPDVGTHIAMAFLTTDASPDVAPIHPDATPVILFTEEDREKWMNAPWEIARDLQKPPAAEALKIVARGSKQDTGRDVFPRSA
jgi:putative SOS response-associated peptidase YedK